MNLMTFVRLLALVVVGWIVLALGAGVLGVGGPDSGGSTFFLARRSLHDTLPMGRLADPLKVEYRLLDQTSGQTKALTLPAQQQFPVT
jgi:hypothetical protein